MTATTPCCARHPGARAGWSCARCQAPLCPGCVFVRRLSGTVELVCCSRCGELVEPITVRRAEVRSFTDRLPGALAATFTAGGVLTLLASALVMWFLDHFWVPGAVLRAGVLWGLLFAAVRRAARGEPGLEPPDLSEFFQDVVRPALLGLLANLLVVAPMIAWTLLRPGGPQAPLWDDPVVWLLLAAGVLYVPVTVMQAALGAGLGRMLNPVGAVAAAARLGGDYLRAVGCCAVLIAANALVSAGAARVLGEIPVVSGLLIDAVGLVAPVLMARTLGLLLYVRGDDLELGLAQDYREPALAGAVPRGRPPATAAAPSER